MSYPLSEDEMSEQRLVAELDKRRELRRMGLCDYCARGPETSPCRYRDRHYATQRRTASLEQFHALNVERCEEGFGHKFAEGTWDAADWMTAVVGELGELANLLKKRKRGEDIAQSDIEDEWADTFTYLDLLAECLGIDAMPAVLSKFDRVSQRIGWTR